MAGRDDAKQNSMQSMRELREIAQGIRALQQHMPDPMLTSTLQSLEARVSALHHDIVKEKAMSLGKKILLGLGLAFLSASTIRYWLDKVEPIIEGYRYEQHYQQAGSPYQDATKILEEHYGKTVQGTTSQHR
jgi:hypothetical protein